MQVLPSLVFILAKRGLFFSKTSDRTAKDDGAVGKFVVIHLILGEVLTPSQEPLFLLKISMKESWVTILFVSISPFFPADWFEVTLDDL